MADSEWGHPGPRPEATAGESYDPPQVLVLGDVEELTAGIGGPPFDDIASGTVT